MTRPYVLYVEDDESDGLFLGSCWTDSEIVVPLEIETSVEGAIARLTDHERAERRPVLVLLDINLPGKDGFQLLAWLRDQPSAAVVPVVMFTSSENPADMAKAYGLGARGYVVKPDSLDALVSTVKALKAFWLEVNRLPGGP